MAAFAAAAGAFGGFAPESLGLIVSDAGFLTVEEIVDNANTRAYQRWIQGEQDGHSPAPQEIVCFQEWKNSQGDWSPYPGSGTSRIVARYGAGKTCVQLISQPRDVITSDGRDDYILQFGVFCDCGVLGLEKWQEVSSPIVFSGEPPKVENQSRRSTLVDPFEP